jgi:serine/threonine protein kinase
MYELFHNKTPFDDYNLNKMIENIKKGEFYLNEKLPNEIKDLIKKCLIVDQNKRIKLNEILIILFLKILNLMVYMKKMCLKNLKN